MNEYYLYLQQVLTRCQDVVWTTANDHPLIIVLQTARSSLDKKRQAHSERADRFEYRFSEWKREATQLALAYANIYSLVQNDDKNEEEARNARDKLHAHLESVKELLK